MEKKENVVKKVKNRNEIPFRYPKKDQKRY